MIRNPFRTGNFEEKIFPCSFQATRCYKFYSTPKNHSAAREDCRRDQADLFSWRDNDDENELITAVIAQSNNNPPIIQRQTYAWSGGIIQQGRGKQKSFLSVFSGLSIRD